MTTTHALCSCATSAPIIRGGAVLCAACGRAPSIAGAPSPSRLTQHDAERPSGTGRTKYIRTWHRAHDAGDAEVWREGRTLCMTPGAWARWARTAAPSRTAVAAVVPLRRVSADDDVRAELGLASAGRAGR